MKEYVSTSLETHLFFGRIMKEHALFLLAAFPAGETEYRFRGSVHGIYGNGRAADQETDSDSH